MKLKSNQYHAGALTLSPKTDNAESSIYFNPFAVTSGFVSGSTGSWGIGIAGNDSKIFSIYNPNINLENFKLGIDGHALLTQN